MMAGIITYTLTITMVKISILLLYRRIFCTLEFRRTTSVVGILCLAWFIISVSMVIFQCHPVEAAFDPHLLFTDHCIDLQAFYWGTAGANVVLDVILWVLPVQMV